MAEDGHDVVGVLCQGASFPDRRAPSCTPKDLHCGLSLALEVTRWRPFITSRPVRRRCPRRRIRAKDVMLGWLLARKPSGCTHDLSSGSPTSHLLPLTPNLSSTIFSWREESWTSPIMTPTLTTSLLRRPSKSHAYTLRPAVRGCTSRSATMRFSSRRHARGHEVQSDSLLHVAWRRAQSHGTGFTTPSEKPYNGLFLAG
jgi:hypothetical protein